VESVEAVGDNFGRRGRVRLSEKWFERKPRSWASTWNRQVEALAWPNGLLSWSTGQAVAMHEVRRRFVQPNPRNPAYCEMGRPYLGRTSGLALRSRPCASFCCADCSTDCPISRCNLVSRDDALPLHQPPSEHARRVLRAPRSPSIFGIGGTASGARQAERLAAARRGAGSPSRPSDRSVGQNIAIP
jgi:hypothetical protein